MFYDLFNYLIIGVTEYTHIGYFLLLLFITEFIKNFTFYNPKYKIHIFKFDKNKKLPFTAKWMAVFIGFVLGIFFYYFNRNIELNIDIDLIQKLIITYTITTSFYELFFEVVVNKFKDFLYMLGKAKINPIIIDLNERGYGGGHFYDYSGYNRKEKNKHSKHKQTDDVPIAEEDLG